ncbi:hypothetical protein BE08_11125 [Sorangium cellulosum]|uniref:Uncharacterized protein n=1 Tax=Sorangium cellulosum TaxID=56 RepID=A0A150P339_SORCE|nr:hypothetical protein BE08_11125 [Sorangium cellulosum]
METKEQEAGLRGAGIAASPNEPTRRDQLQVDVGTYELYQGPLKVGELFVEYDPQYPGDPRRGIEHWCLFGAFKGPSCLNKSTSIAFRYVNGGHGSSTDFRTHVRALWKNDPALRYIQARCQEQQP